MCFSFWVLRPFLRTIKQSWGIIRHRRMERGFFYKINFKNLNVEWCNLRPFQKVKLLEWGPLLTIFGGNSRLGSRGIWISRIGPCILACLCDRYLVGTMLYLLLHVRRVPWLDALLMVLRLQLSDWVHPIGVSHGVHLADGDAGRPALYLRLPRPDCTPDMYRSDLCSRHRRHLRCRRAVSALQVLRDQLWGSDRPVTRWPKPGAL